MASLENVETVQRWIDAFNRGGFDAVIDPYWHDEIELFDPPELPDAGQHAGKEAVRNRVEAFLELGWDGQFRVDELIAVGDEVVMVWRVIGRLPSGDMPLDTPWVFVLKLEDGKVRRIRQFMSKAAALEATPADGHPG